jgi:membrane protease YdiL (CAAX protease family)
MWGGSIAALLIYQKYIRRKDFSSIGIKNPIKDWKNIILGFFLSLFLVFLITYISIYGTPWKSPWNYQLDINLLKGNLALYFERTQQIGLYLNIKYVVTYLPIIIIGYEEILYRGFLQTKAMDNFGRWKGIFIVSIFFAFSHIKYSLLERLWLLPISFLLCILYARKRNIASPLIAHMLYDFMLFVWHY